jgi:OOP family OmpA-OmpF porin
MKSTLHAGHPARRHLPRTLLALAAMGPLLAGTAHAQSDDGYWTWGIGAGQTRGAFDELGLTQRNSSAVPPNVITSYSIATDRRDAGGKVFLGRQLNRYIGVELGYFDLGKFGWQATSTPAGTVSGEIRSQGAKLDLLGTLPITTKVSALARVGATYARTRSEYAGSGALAVTNRSPSERDTRMKLGLGLQYAFSEGFQMRTEAEEYRVSDALGGRGKVKMYSVSLVFPFGRAPQPAPRVAYVAPAPAPQPRAEPMVMAPSPPPPAPVVVAQVAPPAPAPVPLRRVRYGAESLFGFGTSAVQASGAAALDTFAAELAGTQYDSVRVEGHTDRLGSTAFNQNLSMQRAEAVKDYLVRNRGLDAAKLSAVGMGEDKPITKLDDCKGNTQSPRLIACLQPDRRVDLEVSGTR